MRNEIQSRSGFLHLIEKVLVHDFDSAARIIAHEALKKGVSPTLANHFFLYEMVARNPLKGLRWLLDNLPLAYTPYVAEGVKKQHLLKQVEEPALNPEIFQYDQQLIDDVYKKEGNIAEKENRIIDETAKKLIKYIAGVYEFYTGKNWNELPEPEQKAHLAKMIIVGSDNGRVLGIGDWGSNARIAKGKIACYFAGAAGGLLPEQLAAIGFDVGTDNNRLIEDRFYDGLKESRKRNEDYFRFMRLMLKAIDKAGICVFQFEDFQGEQAWELLGWARDNLKNTIVFNDDIEGTASMAMNSLFVAESRGINLENSMYIFNGAGGAGSGMAQQTLWKIEMELKQQGVETDEIEQRVQQVKKKMIFADTTGVLYKGRTAKTKSGKREFHDFQKKQGLMITDENILNNLKSHLEGKGKTWGDAISLEQYLDFVQKEQGQKRLRLGENGTVVIIGTTTEAGGISKELIKICRDIIKKNGNEEKEAVVFGMSNPTGKTDFLTPDESEKYIKSDKRTKEKLLRAALKRVIGAFEGKVLIATGSPFPAVEKEGKKIDIGQGNNVFIFPGVGLGLSISGVTGEEILNKINEGELWKNLWVTASAALFEWYSFNQPNRLAQGVLMPKASDIPEITKAVAYAVASKIRELAGKDSSVDLSQEYEQRKKILESRSSETEKETSGKAFEKTLKMIQLFRGFN